VVVKSYRKNLSKSIYLLVFSIILLSLASASIPKLEGNVVKIGLASTSLDTFKQNECVNIKVLCDNCTYVNLTSVSYPINSSDVLKGQYEMTGDGGTYNYSFCNTNTLGIYSYTSCGNDDGNNVCISEVFEITSTGESYNNQQGFLILGLVGVCALFFAIGLSFDKKKWKVRSLFFMAALFIVLIILNSIRVLAGSSTIISTMTIMALILGMVMLGFMFLYLFIYATIEVFHYFKNKREMKWKISDQ